MTDEERKLFLKALSDMIVQDFGAANTDGTFEPLCPHCVMHHALRTILNLYVATQTTPQDDDDLDGLVDMLVGGS